MLFFVFIVKKTFRAKKVDFVSRKKNFCLFCRVLV